MKAWVLNSIGNIEFTDADMPLLMDNEVLVCVKAAGICGSDIPRVYKTGAHKMPLIPGHEFSGVVTDVGKAADKGWKSKRVGVYPLIPCGKCSPCRNKHPEMCRDYGYLGSRRDGAFAQYVAVPETNLIELPENVSFEQAAMLEPMAVAVHAMRMVMGGRGNPINLDAAITVCGLGTIGLLLVMFLKEAGYENISVIGNKDGQKRRVALLGIGENMFCDSTVTDASRWMNETAGGADVYFECVGKNECLRYGVENAKPGAYIVLVGNPYSDMSLDKDTYWKILRDQLVIRGSWNSTFYPGHSRYSDDDWSYVLKWLTDRVITPEKLISHRLSLDELGKGLILMKEKKEDYCKVMLVSNELDKS